MDFDHSSEQQSMINKARLISSESFKIKHMDQISRFVLMLSLGAFGLEGHAVENTRVLPEKLKYTEPANHVRIMPGPTHAPEESFDPDSEVFIGPKLIISPSEQRIIDQSLGYNISRAIWEQENNQTPINGCKLKDGPVLTEGEEVESSGIKVTCVPLYAGIISSDPNLTQNPNKYMESKRYWLFPSRLIPLCETRGMPLHDCHD